VVELGEKGVPAGDALDFEAEGEEIPRKGVEGKRKLVLGRESSRAPKN